jgi:c-di-GMP-binding flagellar brake protein YcgR
MPTTSRRKFDQVFAISLAISLEFEERETPQFLLSRVEDIDEDRLWVAMPMRAGMFMPLPVDTPVFAHIKKDDATYTLRTRVVARRLQPTPMLELLALGDVERRQQRQYVRLQIVLMPTLAAVIGDDGAETRLAATIVNLSAGGVMLRTRQPVEVGQRIRLNVDMPAPGGAISATTTVLRVDSRRAERGHYYEAGCTFDELTDRDRDLITKFIFRAQVRQRQESGATQ